MHARVNRIEAPPEQIDEAARRFKETIVPMLQGLDGFRGCVTLADRSTGTNIAISYWESEEAMRASEEAVRQPRADAVAAAQATAEPIIERYEVMVQV